MRKYALELVVFLCGAIVMVFELVGSRVMAPYVGTSIYVWSSLIGIILASLSIGYWRGGRLADKTLKQSTLGIVVAGAAVAIAVTLVLKDFLLNAVVELFSGIQIPAIIGTIILFAPASVFLGMVTPYAIRLRIETVDTSGRTVGNMYALSTVGSIAGTFATGFLLIPLIGSKMILVGLAVTLILMAIYLLVLKPKEHPRMVLFVAVIAIWSVFNSSGNIDKDTQYNRVLIYNETQESTGKEIKVMRVDNHIGSAKYLDNNELVYDYLKYFDLAPVFLQGTVFSHLLEHALMIGGAAYSYPSYFMGKYPEATMDVVEIDPGLTDLAKEHFGLKDNPRMNIIHEDARMYLRYTNKKYDVIYSDAFNALYTIPFHLTTQEAVQDMHRILEEHGVVLVNILGSINGERSEFLRSEMATFKSVFPQVFLYAVQFPEDPKELQNIILVALKSTTPPLRTSADPYIYDMLRHHINEENLTLDLPVLTDDHAPVQYYMK